MNPGAGYWMDIFSHLFVVRIVLFFEKTKISRKEAGVGPFKKNSFEDYSLSNLIERLIRVVVNLIKHFTIAN